MIQELFFSLIKMNSWLSSEPGAKHHRIRCCTELALKDMTCLHIQTMRKPFQMERLMNQKEEFVC